MDLFSDPHLAKHLLILLCIVLVVLGTPKLRALIFGPMRRP